MAGDSCCGPITILFFSILAVTVLYLILGYDYLCSTGIFLTAILGLIILYELITSPSPSEPATRQERPESRPEYQRRGRKKITAEDIERLINEEKKRARMRDDEDAEADEDLFIAYEAMNDWEDFENL